MPGEDKLKAEAKLIFPTKKHFKIADNLAKVKQGKSDAFKRRMDGNGGSKNALKAEQILTHEDVNWIVTKSGLLYSWDYWKRINSKQHTDLCKRIPKANE